MLRLGGNVLKVSNRQKGLILKRKKNLATPDPGERRAPKKSFSHDLQISFPLKVVDLRISVCDSMVSFVVEIS